MRRMHKPDPTLPADAQDKRSVVAIEPDDYERWLGGSLDEIRPLITAPALEILEAYPVAKVS